MTMAYYDNQPSVEELADFLLTMRFGDLLDAGITISAYVNSDGDTPGLQYAAQLHSWARSYKQEIIQARQEKSEKEPTT
jgi:hypothetical protein